MLISKIPVLDKGYVGLIDSSNTTKKLRDIGQEFFGGDYPSSIEELGTLTLVLKCPIFIQLTLSKYNFKIIGTKPSPELEAFIPKSHEIGTKDRQLNDLISDDIDRTTQALMINPKAYRADGADSDISQILTPINIYTTLIVHGSYNEWCKFAYKNSSKLIESYSRAIQQIIEAEWKP
ncbi:MAG: hypothetical protein EB127_18000 [Alphaproteobacteria bacterium]|nr:hypothetical protein [Alphaproteobacteria bacterium]